ncbi:penicillin-binding protein [Paenibacillus baekrokdamisoli]|uniref:Penicillin-binding protein n=1 Tax=Paenibacillus baekrokdamisoli TaxID=1712516 RepID=A0A3G9J4A7_9BACL|nr:PBP1A family penicillin-binding protein [Paenibacillus baekrokdamisoli]MBB3072304.1 1A family penicillin-binding protein [Paenibacillus baekrokdamisoli]BBH23175.1 penicillin-binding protein [Paenibacillus baekrokdamisoli]
MRIPKWRQNGAKRRLPFRVSAELWMPKLRLLKRLLIYTGSAMAIMFLTMFGFLFYLRMQALPVSSISQSSQMLDLQGNVIDSFHAGENRQSVPLKDISPYLVEATLAIEDQRFYDHLGFDIKGMARAVIVNLEHLSTKQGASTLTQQLARNLYLTHERTWSRKLKEAMYTLQLEMHYSKDEILSLYLNQIYYGHGAYGAEAAAEQYYGKHASQLTLAESAMLAGIPKGPKYYSPYMDMKNAKDRQKTILSTMADQGIIQRRDADAAALELLKFQPLGSSKQDGIAPFFRDYVHNMAVEKLGIDERLLSEGGIRIYTTLDPNTQRAAEQAVNEGFPGGSEQQAALVSIDPRTGYIKAMVGGRDYKSNQFNRVFAQTRQPGSSFKPIVYMTALQGGIMTPVSKFKSEPTTFTYDEGRQTYAPNNYNDKYVNDFIDMRQAIASSDNIYAVNTIMKVGPDKVIEMARKLGIESPMKPLPSLALGTFPVSPFEMASAFGTFANGGKHVEPTAILRIEDSKGAILYQAQPVTTQVVDPAYAYVLTSLMESVFETGGTGSRVSAMINRPVAGKTGTTAADAWLVGYTPELTTAVWVGYDKGRKLTQAEAHRAAPIFASYIEKALSAVPPKIFQIPDGVVSVYIDPKSGKLAASTCPSKRLESFVSGSQPTEVCGEHKDAPAAADGTGDAQKEQSSTWWNQLRRWWRN